MTESNPNEPRGLGGPFGSVLIGVTSLAGVAAIGWTLWPTSLGGTPAGSSQVWEVEGLKGVPAGPPEAWSRGNRVRAGDVSARLEDGELTFRFVEGGGRGATSPTLINAADKERVDVLLRLRGDRRLRERAGVTMEQLKPAIDAGRGEVLRVPEAERQAVRAAMERRDDDAAPAAVAAAGNAARADFLERTEIALAALRSVVSDDLIARVRAADAAPPTTKPADEAAPAADRPAGGRVE